MRALGMPNQGWNRTAAADVLARYGRHTRAPGLFQVAAGTLARICFPPGTRNPPGRMR